MDILRLGTGLEKNQHRTNAHDNYIEKDCEGSSSLSKK